MMKQKQQNGRVEKMVSFSQSNNFRSLNFFRKFIGGGTMAIVLLTIMTFESATASTGFAKRLDQLQNRSTDPVISKDIAAILEQAGRVKSWPIIRRVDTLEDFSKLDGKWARKTEPHKRTEMMSNKENARLFGLATTDMTNARMLLDELPLLAAAYRFTGDESYRERLVSQLEEFSTWDPLQRRGWTLRVNSADFGKRQDGVWLATGCAIQALVIMLDLLPEEALSPDLREKLDELLKRELERSVSDWENKVPWYVKAQKIQSNQWVVPASGIALAALQLGKERFPKAYELAKNSLRRSLGSLSDEGAVSEGFGYAIDWTIPALVLTAHYMAQAGDKEFIEHPFIRKFPFWLTQHYQPGKNVINAFDWWGGQRNMYDTFMPKITMLTALTEDPQLQWILFQQHGKVSRDVFGLISLGIPSENMQKPALFAVFERAARVNWRSSWSENADGVWIRGWHRDDFHAHDDAGHVNYIKNGKIVLLEAGTGGYSDPRKSKEYDSVCGHNVLQVGDEIRTKKVINALLDVSKLNATGGDVSVDAAAAYPGVSKWLRRVVWNDKELKVSDEVELEAGKRETLLFRWHLGTANEAVITRIDDKSWKITVSAGELVFPGWIGQHKDNGLEVAEQDIVLTPEIDIIIKSRQPLKVVQSKHIDHTMKFRLRYNMHTLIEVYSAEPIERLHCETQFRAR